MTQALIDVVMPVFNSQEYLGTAVRSILNQSFADLHLICVDDGSTDQSSEILAEFAAHDSRITLVRQSNQGVTGALNNALELCNAPLIARMDADDISKPDRFAEQIKFLDRQPDVVAAGTSILEIDSDGAPLAIVRLPQHHDEIDQGLLNVYCGLAHPTVMMRREAIQSLGGYRREYEGLEDLDLWLRMAERGRLANVPDVLLCYRQHSSSVSWKARQGCSQLMEAIMIEAYERRGLTIASQVLSGCRRQRSLAGPTKWARRASRGGQWRTACKHMRTQWRQAPTSLVTWRMSVEVGLRLVAGSLAGKRASLPTVPD